MFKVYLFNCTIIRQLFTQFYSTEHVTKFNLQKKQKIKNKQTNKQTNNQTNKQRQQRCLDLIF